MLLINIGSCRSFFGLFFLDPLPIVLYVILFRSPGTKTKKDHIKTTINALIQCNTFLESGWFCVCAKCNDLFSFYFTMTREVGCFGHTCLLLLQDLATLDGRDPVTVCPVAGTSSSFPGVLLSSVAFINTVETVSTIRIVLFNTLDTAIQFFSLIWSALPLRWWFKFPKCCVCVGCCMSSTRLPHISYLYRNCWGVSLSFCLVHISFWKSCVTLLIEMAVEEAFKGIVRVFWSRVI